MKIIALLFVIVVPTLATEEYTDDISQLLDDPHLILELVKRLGSDKASFTSRKQSFPVPDKPSSDTENNNHHVPVVHGDFRSCEPRLSKKTIIRTKESRNMGASFLDYSANVKTNAECLEKCCSKKGCDLAVYENKTKHSCYLFKCHDENGLDLCVFASHDDYLSTQLINIKEDMSETAPQMSSSKDESKEDSVGTNLEKVTEETKPVQTVPRPTPRPTRLPHSVALGQWCQLDMSCEDPHAMCFQEECQCQRNYYQKNGSCREVCLKEQVECNGRGTARIGPDCIPKSSVCDGTTQCADGSDERDCKIGYQDGSPNSGFTPSQDNRDEKPDLSHASDFSSSSDNLHKTDEDTSKSSEDKTDSSADSKASSVPLTGENKDGKESTSENTADKPVNIDNTGNMGAQQTDPSKVDIDSMDSHKDSKMDSTAGSVDGKSSGSHPEVKTTLQPQKHPKVEVVDKEEEVFVTKEKVIVASPTDRAQGPIVALSLGLAITLMLLIFVGCRLRNVRHRLRKGRPLHSNEADYLINGMYL